MKFQGFPEFPAAPPERWEGASLRRLQGRRRTVGWQCWSMGWQCWSVEEHPTPYPPVLTARTHFSAGSKKSVIATAKRRWWKLNQERGSGQSAVVPWEGKCFKSIRWDPGRAVLPAGPAQRTFPRAQKAPRSPQNRQSC